VTHDRALADLQDLLRRADLLKSWDQSNVYRVDDCLRVDFSARIAVRTDAHARPGGVDFTEAAMELTLKVAEGDNLEAIRECCAQVVIDGINAEGDIFRFALHFDRHDPLLTATDLHAHYHWQVGGDLLAAQEFGTVLHLEGPRFPWHPLDPVLLVDFVLGHFHGAKRAELMEAAILTRYPRILFESQTSFVVPFFTALHQALTTEPFVQTPYWPFLCGPPD
jgi:hypothetical protein